MACVALAEAAAHLMARLAPSPWPVFTRLSVLATLLGVFLELRYVRPMARLRAGSRPSAGDTRPPLAGHEPVSRIGLRDPVTGLHGPRFLDECWPREVGRADRYRHGLGVALLELDGAEGHGPEALCAIGHALEVSLRPDDLACRLETGEVVVVVPDVAPPALQRRLVGLATLVAAVASEYRSAEGGAPLRITGGWSVCPDDGRRLADVLRVARNRGRRARADTDPGFDPGAAIRSGRYAGH